MGYDLYHLVMTNSSPWYRWPIEIDGLPNLKMVDLSMAMLNNQMVTNQLVIKVAGWKIPMVNGGS
jgi:hypothetical protein